MFDFFDHPPYFRSVLPNNSLIHLGQPQADQRRTYFFSAPDLAFLQGHFELICHILTYSLFIDVMLFPAHNSNLDNPSQKTRKQTGFKKSGGNFFDALATTLCDLLRTPESPQTVHGRLDQIMRIMRADTLGQYIMHPGGFKYGADRTTSYNSGSFYSRLQHYIACPEFPKNLMRDAHVGYGNTFHVLARLLNTLPDCLRNLIGFAKTATDLSFSISDNYNGAKAETTSTLDHFRSSIDMNDLFNKLVVATHVLIKI